MVKSKLNPINVQQAIIQIDGVSGQFVKMSEPKETLADTEYNDGNLGQTLVHTGFINYDNVTIEANFDPAQHEALLEWKDKIEESRDKFTVTVQPVKANREGTPIDGAKTLIMSRCTFLSFTYPAFDREGSGMARIAIEFRPGDIQRQ